MITLSSIPVGIRTPGSFIEFDNSRAVQGLPVINQRILVIGQRLATGAVAALVPTRMLSAAQADEAFGQGSMLAGMVAALKTANRYTDAYAVALDDDATGVAATGSFTVTGPATVAGTLCLYLGGVRVPVGVTAGMTEDAVATAAAAAINAVPTLPVTANANGATCEVVFRHSGETGNGFDLRLNDNFSEVTPAGLTVTVTAMQGGTGNPDLADVIAVMGDTPYHTIALPYTDAANLTAIETEQERRWGPMVQREGQVFAGVVGSVATMMTLGETRNSKHLSLVETGKAPTPPWIMATVVAAVDAAEPDPARPRQTLPLPGCRPAAEEDRPTREERNAMLHAGVSTVVVDEAGVVRIERLITTYRVDPSGDQDISYLNIETMRTLAYLRTSLRQRISDRYPRHKLGNDGGRYAEGQLIATPNDIKATILHLARDWESAALLENFDQFAAGLVIERNASDPDTVDALIPPDVVNQFRVFNAQIQFLL